MIGTCDYQLDQLSELAELVMAFEESLQKHTSTKQSS